MFIDTHTHLSDDYGLKPDIYIKNAIDNNVNYIIVSCCDKDSLEYGVKLINKYNNIYLTIGYHPDEVDKVSDIDILKIEELVNKYPKKIVGIGEIGLDYYHNKDNKKEQINLFKKQLDLAVKLNLPVVIHSRDSIQEVYDILKEYKLTGSIHCFSGSIEMSKLFINLGYKIGIGGVVTFKNSKLYQVVEEIGLENIILETDSPYLSPFRGDINESKNIVVIAEKLAEILNTSIEDVSSITTCNAVRLFDLDITL